MPPVRKNSSNSNNESSNGGIVLIDEIEVSGSAASEVEFSSLDLSDYFKVELISLNTGTSHTEDSTLQMQINDISSSSYNVEGDGGLSGSGEGGDDTKASIGKAFNATDDQDLQNLNVEFLYPGATNQRIRWSSSYVHNDSGFSKGMTQGHLENDLTAAVREAAITSIKLFCSTGNLEVGSIFKLIGYKH